MPFFFLSLAHPVSLSIFFLGRQGLSPLFPLWRVGEEGGSARGQTRPGPAGGWEAHTGVWASNPAPAAHTRARAAPLPPAGCFCLCARSLFLPALHTSKKKKEASTNRSPVPRGGRPSFSRTHGGGGEVARARRRARGVVAAAIRQHSPNGVVAAGGGARPERGTGEGGRTNTHRPAAMSPVRAPARAPPQGWDERGQRHRGGRGRVVVRAARPAHALPSPGARTHTHTHTHTRRRRVLASPRLLGRNGGKDGAPHKAGPQGGAGRAGGV